MKTTYREILEEDLALAEKELGKDSRVAKQLRIQIAVLDDGGNVEAAFKELDDLEDTQP